MIKTKKIKVCQVSTIPFAIRFLLLNQIKNLQKEGYEVSAVCSPGKWIKEIEEKGIKVKPITMTRRISPFSDFFTLLRLIRYFKKEKFDIVHTSTPKAGVLGVIAAKIAGVPIIIHSNLGFYFQKDSHWIKRRVFLFVEKITAKCSSLVFSVARPDIQTAIREKVCSEEKIKYMGWWVDLNRFNPNRFSEEFIRNKKKELGIDLNKKVIGINARLVRDKGYYELFESFKEILKEFPNTLLLIIGPEEPEKRDRINPITVFKKFGIKDNVLYLGERTDVDELYGVMDIFVLPSYREGVAVSVLEALAMERPVIATEVGGIPDSIEHQKTGILIPPKNIQSLTKELSSFLKNLDQAKNLGVEGRKRIIERFNEQIVFSRIKNEYKRLIKEKLRIGIKICHVTSVELTIRFILFNTLIFLKNQGYDISVVCSRGKWIKNIRKHGIKEKTIRFKRKFSPFSDLIAFVKLYFYFRKEKFDIVHTHTLKPKVLGQLAAKLAGIPIIINTNHGFDFSDYDSNSKQRFFVGLEKIAARCSDLIFVVSKLIMSVMIDKKICSQNLLRYRGEGIDITRFNPERFSQDFIIQKKKEIGIDPDKKVIGIVARLVEEKGYLDLFQSFKAVLNKFPNTVLLVIGPKEPEKRDAINPDIVEEYNIENNVIFLGERSDVEQFYPLMDIFVLPTHREGFGLVILEASAMEKPVIASDVGGCPEAVNNEKTGILTPPKDINKLTEAIIYLFNNPEKVKQFGRAGREKVKREFSENIVFDRIEKEYSRLINQKLTP